MSVKSEEEQVEQAALAQINTLFDALVSAVVFAMDPEQAANDPAARVEEAAERFRIGLSHVRMVRNLAIKVIRESV